MRTTLLLCLISAPLAWTSAQAQTPSVAYDLRGAYANGVPSTSLSAPGAGFDFELSFPSSPQPGSYDGGSLSLTPSFFSFALSGRAVGVTLADLTFYAAADNGAFTASLSTPDGTVLSLNLSGDPLFGGTTQAPIFRTGTFSVDGDFSLVTGASGGPVDLAINNLTLTGRPVSAAPEPSGAVILGLGVVALGLVTRRARRPWSAPLTSA